MIVKPAKTGALPSDPRLKAGEEAERQMAHYLHRAFATDEAVHVLNDLRLEDPEQPEGNGSPGVCQIDHLVVHRHGLFIVESKSVHETVAVKGDGTGRGEWVRIHRGKETGMPSPIEQAHRQADLLRGFLSRNAERLLGKVPTVLRTIAKLVHGSDQRGFRRVPIQVIVAFADRGNVDRRRGWKPPDKPFKTYVSKADNVCSQIREEIGHHRSAGSLLSNDRSDYGVWSMSEDEAKRVAEFLAEQHAPSNRRQPRASVGQVAAATERPGPPPAPRTPTRPKAVQRASATERASAPTPPRAPSASSAANTLGTAQCRHCNATELIGKWGKYGYYWSCAKCDGNTPMPAVCEVCGHEGKRGQGVRIRKDGERFIRVCEQCGVEHAFWTGAAG